LHPGTLFALAVPPLAPMFAHIASQSVLALLVELTRKNGVSKVGGSFMCNRVACSKATGQTYCNIEWVNDCAILPKTRLARTLVLSIPGVDTLAALPHPAQGGVSTWTLCGGRLVPRRANERYTAEPTRYARLGCQAYHRHPGRTRLAPPPASTRSLLMPTEQGRSTPSP
jgi:hypothetical protein